MILGDFLDFCQEIIYIISMEDYEQRAKAYFNKHYHHFEEIADYWLREMEDAGIKLTPRKERSGYDSEYVLQREYDLFIGPLCPQFRIGVAVNLADSGEIYKVQTFAQARYYIDKFKPSASLLCTEDYVDCQDEKPVLVEVGAKVHPAVMFWGKKLLRFITTQPFLAFYRDVHFTDYNTEYVSPQEAQDAFFEAERKRMETGAKAKRVRYEVVQYIANLLYKNKETFKLIFDEYSSPSVAVIIEDKSLKPADRLRGGYFKENELKRIENIIESIEGDNNHVHYASGIYPQDFEEVYWRKNVELPTKPWIEVTSEGGDTFFTPGGEPSYKCPTCGKGEHCAGIESGHKFVCPDCGQTCFYLREAL